MRLRKKVMKVILDKVILFLYFNFMIDTLFYWHVIKLND